MEIENALKTMETSLKTYIDKSEKSLSDIQVSSKVTTEQLDAFKKDMTEARNELKDVQKQLYTHTKNHVAGAVREDHPEKGFTLQGYIGARWRLARGFSEKEAWRGAEIEKEVLDTIAKQRGESVNKTAMQVSDPEYGGYLVIPEELSNQVVDLMVAKMPLLTELKSRVFKGLLTDFAIPQKTSKPTGYWVGETGKPTETATKLGKVYLRKKKVGAFAKVTKDLIYQSRGTAEEMIKDDLAEALSLTAHAGLVTGTGGNFQPLGLLNDTANTTSAPTAINNILKFDDFANQIEQLANANYYYKGGNFSFLTHPGVLWSLKRQTVAQYSAQAARDAQPVFAFIGKALLDNDDIESQLGHPVYDSTHMTVNSSGYYSVAFGDWNQHGIGMWRDFELNISAVAGDGATGSAFLDDEVYIVAFQTIDRCWLRPQAFCIRSDATLV